MEQAAERPASPTLPSRRPGSAEESAPISMPSPAARPSIGAGGRTFRARGLSLKVRLLVLVLMSVVPTIAILAIIHVLNMQASIEAECLARGEATARWIGGWLARNPYDAHALQQEVDWLLATRRGLRNIAVFLRRDPERPESLQAVASGGDRALREIQIDQEYVVANHERVVVQQSFAYTDEAERERYFKVSAPVTGILADGSFTSGAATIEVSLAEPDRTIARLRNSFVAIAIGALLVTATTLVLYLNRAINAPTNALVGAMDRARRGDLEVQAPIQQLDEFGWLAESFNRLVKRVREVDEVLKARVEAATGELARKNVELVSANERLFETERSVARLERLASLGQLASTIAHEVGTPLNAIYGHIQLMRADPALLERHGERLGVIESQIERLTMTIQGVLTDLRAPEVKFAQTDLNAVLRELTALTDAACKARSVKVELALATDLPTIHADRAQLSQVFVNLLTNALDAMPAGGRIRIETRRATLPAGEGEAGDEAVAAEFWDSGVGISAEDLKRVFEPFYSTKALGHGTGLGLAICHQVVKRHGGTIQVTSETGRGSTFLVLLPRAAHANDGAPAR